MSFRPFDRAALALAIVALLVQADSTRAQRTRPAGRVPPAGTAPVVVAGARETAGNPYEADLTRQTAELNRLGTKPEAIVLFSEVWGDRAWVTPQSMTRFLDGAARNRRLTAQVRALAAHRRVVQMVELGQTLDATRALDALGYVRDFNVLGPFDNEGKTGADRVMPPEAAPLEERDRTATFPGKERDIQWRTYPRSARLGYVNYDAIYRPNENVCAFAETFISLDRARTVSLWIGAGGATKVYWNGELSFTDTKYRSPTPDRFATRVAGRAGWNRVLVKSCVSDGRWGFFLRVGEEDGRAIPSLEVSTDHRALAAAPAEPEACPDDVAMCRPSRVLGDLPTAITQLEGALERSPDDAAVLETLARVLLTTGSDDPAERKTREYANRAAEKAPTAARLRLASRLADTRGERMRFIAEAERLAPNDPEVRYARAQIVASGPTPEAALPLFEAFAPSTTLGIRALVSRSSLTTELGLPRSARAYVDSLPASILHTLAGIRLRAQLASASDSRAAAETLRREAVRLAADDAGLRSGFLTEALLRGDQEDAREQTTALREGFWDSTSTLLEVARAYESLGDGAEAMATYQLALALAPEDAGSHVAYAQALLRADQKDAAADALRTALRVRPQDAPTRELLEQLASEARPDEAYAANEETILARRTAGGEYHSTVLQRLQVNTVYPNGLGSTFHQVAVQINDNEGARQWRVYGIQFSPGAQVVDVRLARVYRNGRTLDSNQSYETQLGEPWYRIYYDTRAENVVFPDLEPGDIVELRYRVDDVAHRNMFADYYGDIHYLQGGEPVRNHEYVLVTPKTRTVHFNEPRLAGLEHTRDESGANRVDRFVATDVPAIRNEPDMPGYTEIAPYLLVSTYRTWEDVGRWYWGLIRDQLVLNESLRATVRRLIAGAPDTRTKVQRIYDWVVSNTRYVGLEFGIHGYKPYRVSEIVERGFGDCKDKASTLYALLTEAGVEARMVLVRTRRNGAIDQLPASLAVFDHAIAYVPELDLFLDGTAEHSGSSELPAMDQGVSVLVVGPNGAELRRTPVLPPDTNRRERTLQIELRADGSAEIRGNEQIHGVEAAGYRSTYQAEGTRAERLERALNAAYPGAHLESQTFEHLAARERPIEYRYIASVPQFAMREGASLRITPSLLGDLERRLASTAERRYPLEIGATVDYVETRTVRLPAGASVRAGSIPAEPLVETSPFGELRMEATTNPGQLQIVTRFTSSRDRLEPAEYPAYRDWVRRADRALRTRISIDLGRNGAQQ